MTWCEANHLGLYDEPNTPALCRHYHYPKTWEIVNTGPRPTFSKPNPLGLPERRSAKPATQAESEVYQKDSIDMEGKEKSSRSDAESTRSEPSGNSSSRQRDDAKAANSNTAPSTPDTKVAESKPAEVKEVPSPSDRQNRLRQE
jgi:hypothetical protein